MLLKASPFPTSAEMGKFLNGGPHKVLKSDRSAGPGANRWCVLVIHPVKEKNNTRSGQNKLLES